MLSQVVWQECLVETPESVWAPFSLFGLLGFCHLAYLQYWVLCMTTPRLAPSQSASLCVFHGFVEWVVGIFDSAEVLFDVLHFLVCIGGRSSMNLMVSVGVSLMVPTMTRMPSLCTLSSCSGFVCAIVVRPHFCFKWRILICNAQSIMTVIYNVGNRTAG